jgi:hypothetical protein
MANKIIIKKSSVASKVPVAGDLEIAELAVNLADAKLYTKNASGTVIQLGGGSGGGDVSGPASATDNAIARFDSTTGKLIQNSLVLIGDTGSVTGVNALTAESLVINNNATLGASNTDTLDVNARITTDLEPNVNNAKDIGTSGRNWRDAFFGRTLSTVNLAVTGTTSFDGSQGTAGQVLTSTGTGSTPTWQTPSGASVFPRDIPVKNRATTIIDVTSTVFDLSTKLNGIFARVMTRTGAYVYCPTNLI